MIDNTAAMNNEASERVRKHGYIRGNFGEVEATLDACLQIHRWERALVILEQLRAIYDGRESELQRLYNKVLEAMVTDHICNNSSENIVTINTWVERYMQKAGVAPNAQTFALKIKAAMATLSGNKRDRTVLRYWDMAKEHGVNWEVASLREILSDNDLGKLSEISPLEIDFDAAHDIGAEDAEEIAVRDDVVSQRALPRATETAQKGLGMVALKKSLSLFDDANHLSEWDDVKDDSAEVREAYAQQRQLRLERDSLTSAVERWRIEHAKMAQMGITGNLEHGKLGALMWTWHEALVEQIRAELERVHEAENTENKARKTEQDRERREYGPFLQLLDPATMAALTMTTVVNIVTRAGVENDVRLVRLVSTLGHAVESEVQAQRKKQRELFNKQARQNNYNNEKPSKANALKAELAKLDSKVPQYMQWSSVQHSKIGALLCEMLFNTAKINVTHELTSNGPRRTSLQPVFERSSAYEAGKRVGIVTMRHEMRALLSKEPIADILAKQLPMVCKPKPWTGFKQGGYLQAENPILRVKHADKAQADYSRAAAERGDLDQIYAGLDVLGKTAWRINQNVFKVMVDAWNSGEAIAKLPGPEKTYSDPKPAKDASAKEKYSYYAKMQSMQNEARGLHSNRCFQNFQMEIARALHDETFYFPHNLDFRGRAYPIPPYLNQMGADNARGLLLFEQGKALGESGFRWLKVHLANVCGYDKASLTDRAQYADDHVADIRDSVQNPLDGRKWWLEAEDPWQCLATCHELINAIDSGNPPTYVSHLPIHQDGTCNGLQHYAALGGDIAGARQVNLEPGDRPADVYTGVAELVKAEIQQDAEAGDPLARALNGRVTRKIVKQTVMTNVYGVTFRGAIEQVRKQLNEYLPDFKKSDMNFEAPIYIARKIFKGLGKLFEGAHDIQYWFGDCANRITNSISFAQLEQLSEQELVNPARKVDKRIKRNVSLADRKIIQAGDFRSTVVWTTPLKLPVVQPYRVSKIQEVKTHMAHIHLVAPEVTDSVDKRKQLQAFPPNFIHSLDATHMMLSALKAHEQGLVFSAVHDSFWTHATDIDTLSLVLRDAFIRMHSEDIVGRLAAEFKMRYKGHIYLANIDAKSALAQEISTYRASIKVEDLGVGNSTKKGKVIVLGKKLQYYELMQEHKRQKLLASEDPAERAKGEQMVTAASIFEANDGEKHLKGKSSFGETAHGHVTGKETDPEDSVLEAALEKHDLPEEHDVDMTSTLEPLLEASHDEKDVNVLPSVSPGAQGKQRKNTPTSLWLWLPLTFKDVPKKGDWDIRRLKDSVYFFS